MKFYINQKGSFDLTTSIAVFLVCLVISLSVAAFHYWYFPTKYLDFKFAEIQTLLNTDSEFTDQAKDILNTRNDIAYLKLLDQNGVLEESFGSEDKRSSRKYSFNGSDNKTIIIGIKTLTNKQIDGYALLWSLIIGSSISILLLFIIFLVSSPPDRSLGKLSEALKGAEENDYSSKLIIDSSIKGDDEMVSVFNSFNNLIDRISPRSNFEPDEEIIGEDDPEMEFPEEEPISSDDVEEVEDEELIVAEVDEVDDIEPAQEEMDEPEADENEIIEEETGNNEVTITESPESHEDQTDTPQSTSESELYTDEGKGVEEPTADEVDEIRESEEPKDEVKEIITPFKPKVVSTSNESRSIAKNRNVTVLVAKISDFSDLISDLEPSDLNSFITEYRRNASSIVGEYGGVIEALLQDEIVAIFNAPDKQNHPELRSVSAAVEIMQVIAELAKKRKAEGKRIISGKIGLSVSSVAFFTETGIPDKIKDVVDNSRHLCDNTENWKIFVSGELYDCVKEHVEVKQTKVNDNFYFSVVGVEEGVLRL